MSAPPDHGIAIKKMMASIKRQQSTVRRGYPTFVPGMTTASYVRLFEVSAGPSACVLDISMNGYMKRPAPFLTGPDVVDESDLLDYA